MVNDPKIESLQNPRVKAAVKLRKDRARKEAGHTLVEGYREVLRAVENGWQFFELYICPELFLADEAEELVNTLRASGMPIFKCSEAVFKKMSYRDTPDGLLALSPLVETALEDLVLPDSPLLLIAENLEKPGNLGTMLRTADGAGADAVIVCGNKTDINNPNVIRASVGSLFFIPVAQASTFDTISWLRKHGIRSVAALPNAEMRYGDSDMRGGIALVVGSEDLGLSKEWEINADLQVSIPMQGRNDSLNVSTAAAVLLYEASRQRNAR